jgi:hypothetical protein
MVPLLRRSLRGLIPGSSASLTKVVREPAIGPIIPDLLVGVVTRHAPIVARRHFTSIEASVLAFLEGNGASSADAIGRALFMPSQACTRALTSLRKAGAIQESSDHCWVIADGARTSGIEILAFEAKLHLWRRALEQAETYLRFADRAYVVLDGNRVDASVELGAAFTVWVCHH